MGNLSTAVFLHRPQRAILHSVAILIAAGGLLAAACAPTVAPSPTAAPAKPPAAAAPAQPITIRFNVDNADGVPRATMEKRFVDLVQQKAAGKAAVQIYWNGSLAGSQRAAIEVVQNRGADVGIISTSNYSAMQQPWMLLDLPFLTKGRAGYYKFLDGPEFGSLKASAEKEAKLKYLFAIYDGYRSLFTTKKQVKSPADLKGMKIRTTNSPIEVGYVKAFGANPSAIDFTETYLALKQGLVEGTFVAYTSITNMKWEDAIKGATELDVAPVHVAAFMNADLFNGFPADVQKAVLDAARETDLANRRQDEADMENSKKTLVGQGLSVYVPSAAELDEWVKLAKPVYDEFVPKLPTGLVQKVLDSQK